MYSKIAVAVDGTDESLHAVRKACSIAQVHQSDSVSIVTVIPVRVYSDADYDPVREHGDQQMRMVLPATEILNEASVRNEVVMLHGRPADEISRYVSDSGIDLLVMGTRSLSRLRAAALGGSVSRKTLKQVKCPVLLVG